MRLSSLPARQIEINKWFSCLQLPLAYKLFTDKTRESTDRVLLRSQRTTGMSTQVNCFFTLHPILTCFSPSFSPSNPSAPEMALSRLPLGAPATSCRHNARQQLSVVPSLRQCPPHSVHCSSRRHILNAGSALLYSQHLTLVAQAATAVYHEVSVSLPSQDDESDIPEPVQDPPTFVTATGRIIAIGDLHGDMNKTKQALMIARVAEDVGGKMIWTGADTIVVQLGDVLDRGDTEIGILRLLRDLDAQARTAGGAVYMLNGNHESLNVCGDFRYVTPGAFIEAAQEFGIPREVAMRNWDGCIQARAALYLPGGRIARELARNPTVLVVNDTAFAHGGLLPTHVNYGLERMNAEVAAWMRRDKLPDEEGYATPPFLAMGDGNSVMWNRQLSRESYANPIDRFHACNMVTQALARIGAKRLVVGHTPQMRGVNCECEGKVWRVDVGMSSGVLNAPAGVLEISPPEEEGGEVVCKILSEDMIATFDEEAMFDL